MAKRYLQEKNLPRHNTLQCCVAIFLPRIHSNTQGVKSTFMYRGHGSPERSSQAHFPPFLGELDNRVESN